jgi:hypothetical protein
MLVTILRIKTKTRQSGWITGFIQWIRIFVFQYHLISSKKYPAFGVQSVPCIHDACLLSVEEVSCKLPGQVLYREPVIVARFRVSAQIFDTLADMVGVAAWMFLSHGRVIVSMFIFIM